MFVLLRIRLWQRGEILKGKLKKYVVAAVVFVAAAMVIFNTFGGLKSYTKKAEGFDRSGKSISIDRLADLRLKYKTIKKELNERLPYLYYAGDEGNWSLADYELFAIEEDILQANASTLAAYAQFENFNDEYIKPLHKVAQAGDAAGFKNNFDKMVKACNDCHQSTQALYIKIRIPDKAYLNLDTAPPSN